MEINNSYEEPVLYGELTVFGTNGLVQPCQPTERYESKISFYRRRRANGVKPGPSVRITDADSYAAICSKEIHTVSYTMSRNDHIVVEYIEDDQQDMFQIGRSADRHIDFVVREPGQQPIDNHMQLTPSRIDQLVDNQKSANGKFGLSRLRHLAANFNSQDTALTAEKLEYPKIAKDSTISRYACRILIERKPPHTARIYAAGFDATSNIFLGESAIKWHRKGTMDGLTTNGVIIKWPNSKLWPPEENMPQPHSDSKLAAAQVKDQNILWREVTVCGQVYRMRKNRSPPTEASLMQNEENILVDGTLIDLCGVTLIWRSGQGLAKTANLGDITDMVETMNATRIQCPVRLQTLHIPKPRYSSSMSNVKIITPLQAEQLEDRRPFVYLKCGHVHGWHTWAAGTGPQNGAGRTCPMCRQFSKFVQLNLGEETAFYVDRGSPFTYCFQPCGHMASEATVNYWSSINLPNRYNFELQSKCPFCLLTLDGKPVRLIFQGEMDQDWLLDHFSQRRNREQERDQSSLPCYVPIEPTSPSEELLYEQDEDARNSYSDESQ